MAYPYHISNKNQIIAKLAGGPISFLEDGTIIYHADQTPPTESEIITETSRLEEEYDAQAYARNRAADYPSNGDQWDMIYKDNLNSTTTHKDAVEAVKTKWPKDNSGPVE
jgi:hypothetical protein